MALRNAIKATLLESEPPPSRSVEPGLLVGARLDAPPAIVVEPVSNAAPAAPPEEAPAARWRARAKEIRALARTLPRQSKRRVIRQIAGLYDALAKDAARSAPAARPADHRPLEEAAPPALAPPAEPPPAKPRPPRPGTFPRRALPSTRHRSMRR